jgi:glycosyltransferase involved in cell wall biosynthesis
LTIVGSGPEESRLRAMAGPTVTFAGPVEGEALRNLYRRAIAFVLPGEEDFGIAPVESMACGRPVVALGRGGATETVVPGVTGVLVEEATPHAFAEAMTEVRSRRFDATALRAHAERFGPEAFDRGFGAALDALVAGEAAA